MSMPCQESDSHLPDSNNAHSTQSCLDAVMRVVSISFHGAEAAVGTYASGSIQRGTCAKDIKRPHN